MTRLLAALTFFWAGASAQAAVISERPDRIAVTIYHEGAVRTEDLRNRFVSRNFGLAMISETRSVDLPVGVSEVQFRGVAATMAPQSADLGGLEDAALERNFDYDLLSPGSLLVKSIGQTVRLVRTDAKTGAVTEETATIMSAPDGAVLKIGDRYEAFQCSQKPERLVFDRVPDGLIDRPTLTAKIRVKRAGRFTLTLRYVASGLNWSADYVARVRPDGNTLDLSGWLTLANFSESGFPAAAVDVIAGRVQTTGDIDTPVVETRSFSRNCPFPSRFMELWMARPRSAGFDAPTPTTIVSAEEVTVSASRLKQIEARNLADYKQYPLPEPTDVAAMQTKQVQFLDQTAVPFEQVYVCRADDDASIQGERQLRLAKAIFRLRNTADGGLGKSLPAGDVMTMVTANGEPLVTGQGTLRDISVGLPLEIPGGETADVVSEARLVEDRNVGPKDDRRRVRVMEIVLTNQKPLPVNFEWHQYLFDNARIDRESQKHEVTNGDAVWTVSLAPGEHKLLRYTLNEEE